MADGELSDCCYEPVVVGGGSPDFEGDRDGVTLHDACSECNEPCRRMPNFKGDPLWEFLSVLHWVWPNLNDTFHPASADSEQLYMDGASNQAMLVDVWKRFGHAGLVAYCAAVRGAEPTESLRDDAYRAAVAHLEGWVYESD